MNSVILEALRPKQWVKNLFVFAALIFSKHLTHGHSFFLAILAFLAFCAISSSTYLINDLSDKEEDCKHPVKCQRPIASGRLERGLAIKISMALVLGSISLAWLLSLEFVAIVILYLIITSLYTFWFKHVVIMDVMALALGFVLRVVAGGVAIGVKNSSWLLVCTFMLALFLALNKRRNELVLLDEGAFEHRPILEEYSTYFLDMMISVVTACTLITYSLYTISTETVAKFHTDKMSFTIPFVIYGVFRYLYLVHKKEGGGDPTKVILTDFPMIINSFLWFLTSFLIIYVS